MARNDDDSRSRRDQEDDDYQPRRGRDREDDRDERPRRAAREEDDPPPRRRPREDDDEPPARSRRREAEDDDPPPPRDRDRDRGRSERPAYRERSASDVSKRADQQGGAYDSYIKPDYLAFKVTEGEHDIRYLPPMWDNADHYGLDVYVHNNVGADTQTYLCLNKMLGKPCPVCEEKAALEKAGADQKDIDNIKVTKRVLSWLIDRSAEKDGPLWWAASWTVDKDIAMLSQDKKTGEVLLLDHPDKGYDVTFTRTGTGLKTRYGGYKIARNPSPIADRERDQEKWLDYVNEHRLPDILQYFSYDHISKVLSGTKVEKDPDLDEDRPRGRGRLRDEVRDDDPPPRRRPREDDDEPPRRRPRDEDEEPPARSGRKPLPKEEDDPPPRSRRREVEDDDPPPRRRPAEEDDPPPRRRPVSEEIGDEIPDKPGRARIQRDEPEDEEPRGGASEARARLDRLKDRNR